MRTTQTSQRKKNCNSLGKIYIYIYYLETAKPIALLRQKRFERSILNIKLDCCIKRTSTIAVSSANYLIILLIAYKISLRTFRDNVCLTRMLKSKFVSNTTKTRLFKYIENFATRKGTFSDK